jgi:amidase
LPIGKTQTTPFAYKDPAPTRNPHHPGRTPGGSSSGSAAAVAAGHVPFALGTQTIGSILRPASFCGVVGYKPTYGTIPASGVGPLAPSVDHVGWLAANVAVARSVADVFAIPNEASGDRAVRIGFAPELFAERFTSEVQLGLETAARRVRDAGAHVAALTLPEIIGGSIEPLMTIVAFEANAVLARLRPRGFPPEIDGLVERGSRTTYADYYKAVEHRRRTRPEIVEILEPFDAVLLGLANAAPEPGTTGDVMPLGPWSYWGVPAMTIPMMRSAEGLPIGMQLIAAPGRDSRLLSVARWIERTIALSPAARER